MNANEIVSWYTIRRSQVSFSMLNIHFTGFFLPVVVVNLDYIYIYMYIYIHTHTHTHTHTHYFFTLRRFGGKLAFRFELHVK